MPSAGRVLRLTLLALAAASLLSAQDQPLITSGQLDQNGEAIPYEVRHLPVSSFPKLPLDVAGQLTDRGCLIPQTYQARRPENVVHASLQAPGSSDWAVLCSTQGTVQLLVFFGNSPQKPSTVATTLETARLQPHFGSRLLGFNWGIDPATPETIHQAQIGLHPRPPRLDHDALADSAIDRKTIYRYYRGGSWTIVDMPTD
ncbi:hypothetical protein DYQ86_18815 [Acidobacteria bacterium AB60]|nr:hypothetical protein DYQ86_18815 [Acidobacteria bacterium AB60]